MNEEEYFAFEERSSFVKKDFLAKAMNANGEAKVKLGTIQSDNSGLFLMAQASDLLLATFASNSRALELWSCEGQAVRNKIARPV